MSFPLTESVCPGFSAEFPVSPAAIEEAATIVYRHLSPTPALEWPLLSKRLGCEVIVKHENHLPTGAFKVRGGIVYLTWLQEKNPEIKGVISATRGNHGQSLARAAQTVGMKCTIVVPRGNCPDKNAAMRGYGAELVEEGDDFQAACEHAAFLSQSRGLHMVTAYHPWLVSGVSTYGMELFQAHPDLDAVLVAIGQGSGITGVLAAKGVLGSKADVYGVVSENAAAYSLSFRAGKPIATDSADTIADGIACRVPQAAAVKIINQGARDILEISDEDVLAAINAYLSDCHCLAEGAGAATLAGLLRHRSRFVGKKVAVILSGGNAGTELLTKAMALAA